MAVATGEVIAHRYKLIRELGSGAFGRVYLVEDSKAKDGEKRKALKEVNVGSVAIPDPLMGGTLQEARLQRELEHPCVVHFYDSFFIVDKFYMCTEFCEGGDLDEKIQQYKKDGENIPEEQIGKWLVHLILGLRYIHKKNILHRDIKPKNLLLRNDIIKIADFGISKLQQATLASTCIGTPHYMSPEAVNYNGYNDKSDVWAVGCILYEMAAQKPLFDGRSMFEVFKLISTVRLSRWPRSYSRELQAVFESIMKGNPDDRPSILDVQQHQYVISVMAKYNTELHDSLQMDAIEIPPTTATKVSADRTPSDIRRARNPRADKTDEAIDNFWSKAKSKKSMPRERRSSENSEKGKVKVVVYMNASDTQALRNLAKFIQECSKDNTYTSLKDDTIEGTFNPDKRRDKITAIKTETINAMGQRAFNRAYLYLKKARKQSLTESDILGELEKLVPDDQTREYLDHLVYLEMQSDSE